MVIIMKKYFFLIILFIVYLILSSLNNTKQVLSITDADNDSTVITVRLNFTDGINSKRVTNLLDNYNKEYYIKNMIGKFNYDVSCTNIKICIDNVFKDKDDEFYNKYISTGFLINSIELIAYKEEILTFLDNNGILYTIIN